MPSKTFLNAKFVHGLYCAFLKAPPFCNLQMPEPEEVYVFITFDKALHGAMHKGRNHYQIHISKATINHLDNVIITLLHEMVHLHFSFRGFKDTYHTHDAKFKRLANKVCKVFNLDKGTF